MDEAELPRKIADSEMFRALGLPVRMPPPNSAVLYSIRMPAPMTRGLFVLMPPPCCVAVLWLITSLVRKVFPAAPMPPALPCAWFWVI